jgi:transposase
MRKVQAQVLEGKEIFVGLEDSVRTWKVCVRADKMIMHEASMPAQYENLKGYFTNRFPGCKIQVMYEAGFGGFGLHDTLAKDGYACVVTPPNKVTEEKDNRVKNDKVDARRLAKNLENGDYRACHVPDAEQRMDRQINRSIIQADKILKATKNRLRSMLYFHGLSVQPEGRRWAVSDYKRLRELHLSSSLQFCFDETLKQLDESLRARKAFRTMLFKVGKKERYQQTIAIIASMPGFGKYTATRLALELGDVRERFQTGRSLANFMGLTGGEHSTGERVRRGGITKQGHSFYRHWFVEGGWVAIKYDAALMAKFQRVWQHSGSKQKAIVAVARKLVVRMWTLLCRNELYVCDIAA